MLQRRAKHKAAQRAQQMLQPLGARGQNFVRGLELHMHRNVRLSSNGRNAVSSLRASATAHPALPGLS